MHIELLKNPTRHTIEKESSLFKNIKGTVDRVLIDKPKRLQEVYDVFYAQDWIRNSLLEYKDSDYAVKAEDQTDPEQLYIKGVVDGMRILNSLITAYGKTTGFYDDKEEEINE